ncbi:MAG: O-antigen ligase family protein [Aggregatilineales bacterium]
MLVIAVALVVYGALAANWSNLTTAPYRIEAMIGIAVLTLGWLAYRTFRGWQWHRTALDKVLALWLIAFGLSLLANSEVWRRIVIGLWFSGLYITLWYMLHDCISNGFLTHQKIVDGTLLAGTGILVSSCSEVIKWIQNGSHDKLTILSTLDNPNTLGTVLVIMLCLAIGRFFMMRGVPKIIFGVYVSVTAVALFLTFSRGAWLGGGIGVVVFGVLFLVQRKVKLNWPVVIGLAVIAGVIIIGVTVFRGWGDDGRVPIYNAAIQMFKEKPITGYGLYTFGRGLLRIVGVVPQTTTHAQAHDLILNIAAELGITGLIAFGVTIVVFFRELRNNWRLAENGQRILLAGAIAATAGVAAHHLVDVTAMLPAVAVCAFIPLILSMAPTVPEPVCIPRLRYALVSGLVLVILLAGAWDNYTYNLYYTAMMQAARTYDPQGTLTLLQPAINDDPNMPVYRLMQAYFMQEAGNQQGADDAFATLCKLEPNYATWPYDEQEAILQYLRMSLPTPQAFWITHSCSGNSGGP